MLKNYLLTSDGVMFLSDSPELQEISGADISIFVKEIVVKNISFPIDRAILDHILSFENDLINISVCGLSGNYAVAPLIISVEKKEILNLITYEVLKESSNAGIT